MEDIEILVKGLEIGFLVEKASEEGFLDIRNSEELERLNLTGDDVDFLFMELGKRQIEIVY